MFLLVKRTQYDVMDCITEVYHACFDQKETKSKTDNHVDVQRDICRYIKVNAFHFITIQFSDMVHQRMVKTHAECSKYSCKSSSIYLYLYASYTVWCTLVVLKIARMFKQLTDFNMFYIRSFISFFSRPVYSKIEFPQFSINIL